MEKVHGLYALVLCAAFAPHQVAAEDGPFPIRPMIVSGHAEELADFDVRHVGWLKTSSAAADTLSSDALSVRDEAYRRQKVKIRWIYQPLDGGPQFEIGTYGSRKGAMKKKLIHVALDWSF